MKSHTYIIQKCEIVQLVTPLVKTDFILLPEVQRERNLCDAVILAH